MEFVNAPGIITSKAYNMCDLIEANIELNKFNPNDYDYLPTEERIYVRPKSHLQIWLYLKGLKGMKTVHQSYGKIW